MHHARTAGHCCASSGRPLHTYPTARRRCHTATGPAPPAGPGERSPGTAWIEISAQDPELLKHRGSQWTIPSRPLHAPLPNEKLPARPSDRLDRLPSSNVQRATSPRWPSACDSTARSRHWLATTISLPTRWSSNSVTDEGIVPAQSVLKFSSTSTTHNPQPPHTTSYGTISRCISGGGGWARILRGNLGERDRGFLGALCDAGPLAALGIACPRLQSHSLPLHYRRHTLGAPLRIVMKAYTGACKRCYHVVVQCIYLGESRRLHRL